MIPKRLSATALDVAMTCQARYKAEKFDRTPQPSGDAAMRGSTFHIAAEEFVRKVYIEKTMDWDWMVLEVFLMKAYKETFGSTDLDTEQYKDCREMTKRWFDRTDLSTTNIVELEVEREFQLVTSAGNIPFVFIIDRLDRLAPTVFKVVDYKSIRAYISPDDLRSKIQARIYALAVQIMHPEATEIWVEFDMIRHDSPVSTRFTPEDNAKTWYRLIEEAEKIIALDEEKDLPESLNNECMYCVRKSSCATLLKHDAGGGVYAKSGEEAVKLKLKISSQLKALRILEEELDGLILSEADQRNEFTWRVGDIEVKIGARKNTKIDSAAALAAMPANIIARYAKLNVTEAKALLASGELNDDEAELLQSFMSQEYGDPKPKVTFKPVI